MSDSRSALRLLIAFTALVAVGGSAWYWNQRQEIQQLPVHELAAPTRIAVGNTPTGPLRASAPPLAPLEDGIVRADAAALNALRELNHQALANLKSGQFADAVDGFNQALELEPGNEIVLLNLSRAFAQWGQSQMDAGHTTEAIAHLEAAVEAHRDAGENGSLLAYGLIRIGRRAQAASILSATLEAYPNCMPALRLSAEMSFLEGDLYRAIEILSKAAQIAPQDQQVAVRLAFYRRELEVLANFLQVRSTRFDAMFDPEHQSLRPYVEELLLDLEDASDSVNILLGLTPSDRLLVIFMRPEEYRQSAPNWSNGLYDGRIRIPIEDYQQESASLRATFRHEYTHAALHRVGPTVPTWLHEGLAQYVEGRNISVSRNHLQAKPALVPSLADLQGDWTRWTDRDQVQSAYAYALSMSGWLIETYGQNALASLVQGMQGASFEEAFVAAFGDSFESVDGLHRASLLDSARK
jgi:tetratricopeptide (TPR) repeat protein